MCSLAVLRAHACFGLLNSARTFLGSVRCGDSSEWVCGVDVAHVVLTRPCDAAMYGHKAWWMDNTNFTGFGDIAHANGVDVYFCG